MRGVVGSEGWGGEEGGREGGVLIEVLIEVLDLRWDGGDGAVMVDESMPGPECNQYY